MDYCTAQGCPQNEVYIECGTCEGTCAHPRPTACTKVNPPSKPN